ncbi:MAG: branched-chain amino acid ABC transporter substrate-binding protein [Ktedonobacteraceae bacterium]|nr:branched-chain amino acid ABC transporter substrate-binding protein [Ktedonobacteraceae bacterium]MBO0790304.1 branched-chain amino acid ABC transporter substrate-binding protein [Ktedonobacteraceae bacterium]
MSRRLSRIFVVAMTVPLLLAMLAACGAGTTPTTTTTGPVTIKIGTDFPTSGDDTSNGLPAQNGVQMAIDDANAQKLAPNVTFVPAFKNDVGPSNSHDPAVGQKNVTDLIGDNQVAGIVGPFNSSVAQSELPVANQAPIALISPANTNDCLTQETPADLCGGANSKIKDYRPTGKVTYFRIATLDQFQGGSLADFAYTKKNYHKIYIVDDTETYGAGIAQAFEKKFKSLGGTVLGHDQQPKSTTSYLGLLTKIDATHPDAIFFGGNDSTGGVPMRQAMLQVPGLKNTPFLGGDGIKSSSFSRTIAKNGGPVFSSVATIDATGGAAATAGAAKTFIEKYGQKYGANNISAYSASAYDCAMIIMQAVKNAIAGGAKPPAAGDSAAASTFRQAVIDAIQKIDYNGLTGHQSFDKNGDTTSRVITIYTIADDVNVRDGWTPLDTITVK